MVIAEGLGHKAKMFITAHKLPSGDASSFSATTTKDRGAGQQDGRRSANPHALRAHSDPRPASALPADLNSSGGKTISEQLRPYIAALMASRR